MKKIMFALQLLLLMSCTTKKEDISTYPNIVLIVADDMGYGDISCYGNKYVNTPNLDTLAAHGIRFTDFHSNGPVCSPTRAALMTGKYQQRTGVCGVITAKSHREVGLSLDEITIAEELKNYGYNCAMFGKWHLGYSKEHNPSLQGFDKFTGFVSGNVDYHAHIDQAGYLDWWKGTEIDNEEGYSTDLITKHGVNYIQENNPSKTGKPLFLYLPHEAPHGPYQRRIDKVLREEGKATTEKRKGEDLKSIYKEMIEVMDEGVGEIVKSLKETGQYDNTIIIFFSDNGGTGFANNGNLRGHKGTPYEGGSRVPAIISYPDKIKEARVSDELILTMDILPTVLDFTNHKASGENIDGISIKEHLLTNEKLEARDVFFQFGKTSFIRSGDWKLVYTEKEKGNKTELFNLSTDLYEKNNLKSKHPELTKTLSDKLEDWKEEVNAGVIKISDTF